jgi:hypothetical protein
MMDYDLFGNAVHPKRRSAAPSPAAAAVGPDGPVMRGGAEIFPPATERPRDWAQATGLEIDRAVLDWFARLPYGATAEQCSMSLGRDMGVIVARLAARGELLDTGRVMPRPDRRTSARVLMAKGVA